MQRDPRTHPQARDRLVDDESTELHVVWAARGWVQYLLYRDGHEQAVASGKLSLSEWTERTSKGDRWHVNTG